MPFRDENLRVDVHEALAKRSQQLDRDEWVIDTEEPEFLSSEGERFCEPEDRRTIVASLVDEEIILVDACWSRNADKEHAVEGLPSGRRDALEERHAAENDLALRNSHSPRAPADENVAIHVPMLASVPMRVSVVIPALNEAESIASAIDSARSAGADEVIVCVGESTDDTGRIARDAGAIVLRSASMRSTQLNAGATAATGEVLIFLHADTTLPPRGVTAVRDAVGRMCEFGGFRISFDVRRPAMSAAAALINLRTKLTRAPWGDQAQFVSKRVFTLLGGYREIPILEDYDFARRARTFTRVAILPETVVTSARRFQSIGHIRTVVTNWRIIAGFHAGEDLQRLADMYRARGPRQEPRHRA